MGKERRAMSEEVPDPKRLGYKGMTTADRFWAKVNKTETCWEWTGTKLKTGYGVITVNPKMLKAHRVSYMWAKGPIPEGMQIDHICQRPSCVRPDHLRAVTNKQNQENRKPPQGRNISGYRGVYWNKDRRKWGTLVTQHGKRISAGCYADVEEANAAVVALRNRLYTHNDPDRNPNVQPPRT
jgi:hypothetical protein